MDTIAATSDPFPGLHILGRIASWLNACRTLHAATMTQPYDSDYAHTDILFTTLAGNAITGSHLMNRVMDHEDHLAFARYANAVRAAAMDPNPITDWHPPDDATAACQKALGNACTNRRFFTTVNGRIGIGPLPTRTGDLVAVLRRQGNPVILRPSGEVYQLAGGSYVHGIMDGEALADDVEEMVFELV